MVVVKCRFAKSSDLMSPQMSRTMVSDCSAFNLMSLILPNSCCITIAISQPIIEPHANVGARAHTLMAACASARSCLPLSPALLMLLWWWLAAVSYDSQHALSSNKLRTD